MALSAAERHGAVLVRDGDRPYLADEDRSALRVIPLPLEADGERVVQEVVELPGRPAAVLALPDRVLVTVRDPGLLLELERLPDGGLRERARTTLAADAWGLAVTPDGRTALVTSAWTRRVSAVDLESMTLRWSVAVAREPRAVVVLGDGERAYVTHLVGSALTRIDGVGSEPRVTRVAFPAAPLRNPGDRYAAERAEAASLAYSAVLSPDERRLLVPRHALGATGKRAWNGQPTVDVMLLKDESPLARPVTGRAPLSRIDVPLERRDAMVRGTGPIQRWPAVMQPRASVYRASTGTLLIASEGSDTLVELDATSIDPSAHPLRVYRLDVKRGPSSFDSFGETACGAPSGVALSEDERHAVVFCRSTANLALVELADDGADDGGWVLARLAVADEELDEQVALGRRLFYDAGDSVMSDSFACAGCHPDGRDDGHVWHELGNNSFRAFPEHQGAPGLPELKGEARQTPMLAGRLHHDGRFGWRGRHTHLATRIVEGFNLHQWWGGSWVTESMFGRARALAAFLTSDALPAPPAEAGELTAVEQRGRELFYDATTGCASCHRDDGGLYSDAERARVDLRAPTDRYLGDEEPIYRTPPLRFVAGTEPFLHDGSAATLRDLIDNNHDRMGLTSLLSAGDRHALVAFLETLGGRELAESLRAPAPAEHQPCPAVEPPSAPLGARPSPEEWQAAAELVMPREERCAMRRVREWVQIRCRVFASEIELIGGSAEGVFLHHSEPYAKPPAHPWSGWWRKVDDAILEFPLRRGDRRIFQVLDGRWILWGSAVDLHAELVVSALWLPEDAQPTIVVH